MIDEQREFMEELKDIQDFIVENLLIQENKFENTKSLLQEATYQAIYKCMELIDGYGQNMKKYEIKVSESGVVLNSKNSLHDKCEDFLEFSNL